MRFLLLALALVYPFSGQAASYMGTGILPQQITYCFVGTPATLTARDARIREIVGFMNDFTSAANIRFDPVTPGSFGCPAPTRSNGRDVHTGHLRILIPRMRMDATGADLFTARAQVPGLGCSGRNDSEAGSWARFPNEPDGSPACLYNVKLGDDGATRADGTGAYRNHTLHEIGHALGLRHEHERRDRDRLCYLPDTDSGRSVDLTPYDKFSVMHYQFPQGEYPLCKHAGLPDGSNQVNGNYDNTGFSSLDRIGLRILYPPYHPRGGVWLAEVAGPLRARQSQPFMVRTLWEARGANLSSAMRYIRWRMEGPIRSGQPRKLRYDVTSFQLRGQLAERGLYYLYLQYEDLLGRNHYETFNFVVDGIGGDP